MSKKFKAKYTVDLTGVETLEGLNLATVVGKIDASELTADDLATLMVTKIKQVVADNDADGVLVYPDGTCDLVSSDALLEKCSTMLDELDTQLDSLAEAVNKAVEKKQPWYKRLWNKLFGKKK